LGSRVTTYTYPVRNTDELQVKWESCKHDGRKHGHEREYGMKERREATDVRTGNMKSTENRRDVTAWIRSGISGGLFGMSLPTKPSSDSQEEFRTTEWGLLTVKLLVKYQSNTENIWFLSLYMLPSQPTRILFTSIILRGTFNSENFRKGTWPVRVNFS
jgi:hypothetical protein